jgi:hypothetical protein
MDVVSSRQALEGAVFEEPPFFPQFYKKHPEDCDKDGVVEGGFGDCMFFSYKVPGNQLTPAFQLREQRF